MKPPYPHLFAAAALAACAGCFGGESLGNHTGAGGSGGSSPTGGVGGDVGGTTGGIGGTIGAGGGMFCGSYTMPIQPPFSDVLILMDRSSSMNDDSTEMSCTGGCGATSKWSLLAAAVSNLVTENPDVRWGLALYGSDNQCGVGSNPQVAVGTDNGQAISAALAAQVAPGGEAPTSSAVSYAVSYLQALYDPYPKYILLVTDGKSGCAGAADGGTADAAAEAAISLARNQSGISTFVLGLAPSGDSTAIATLNQMAENGGEASQGTANAFYTIPDLGPNFVSVISTGSCVVPLPYLLGVGTSLAVSVTSSDGVPVKLPLDPTNGWSFTDSSDTAISFNGTYCDGLLDGADASFSLYYSCDDPGLGLQ